MRQLQEVLEDSADLAADRITIILAQILDLLGNVLAVEPVVAGPHRAQHLGLVLRPGVEIVVVSGSVVARSVGHGPTASELSYCTPALRSPRRLLWRLGSRRRAG